MKSATILQGLLAAAFTTSSWAQSDEEPAPEQEGPFYLQIQSNESSVNGRYLASCHTGAGMQTLCLSGIDKPTGLNVGSFLYYFNKTEQQNDGDLGYLTWNLPLSVGGETIQNVSLPLTLSFGNVGSNVASTSVSVCFSLLPLPARLFLFC